MPSSPRCLRKECHRAATHIYEADPAFAFCDEHWDSALAVLDPAQCSRLRASGSFRPQRCKHGHSQQEHGAVRVSPTGGVYRYCLRCAQARNEQRVNKGTAQ